MNIHETPRGAGGGGFVFGCVGNYLSLCIGNSSGEICVCVFFQKPKKKKFIGRMGK